MTRVGDVASEEALTFEEPSDHSEFLPPKPPLGSFSIR